MYVQKSEQFYSIKRKVTLTDVELFDVHMDRNHRSLCDCSLALSITLPIFGIDAIPSHYRGDKK